MLAVLCMAGTSQALAFYNPGTGRWLNKDPMQERGGINLYNYCNNDPVNRIDPNGLWSKSVTDDIWTGSIDGPVDVKCGQIKFSSVFIDAALGETYQERDVTAYNTVIGSAVKAIPGANISEFNNRRFTGAGFIANFEKSESCTCCDHFWWEQQIYHKWSRNEADGPQIPGTTFMDFAGTHDNGIFNTDDKVNYILNLYCGGKGGPKQLLKTINWSRHRVITTGAHDSATVTLDISY